MGLYTTKFNPFTKSLQWVLKGTLITFKEGVDTYNNLPTTGNSQNEARITNDTGHLYVWSIEESSGNLSDWADQGDVLDIKWDSVEGKPSSTPANIDDAVSKKHTQGTDTTLNPMTADLDLNNHSIVNVKDDSITFKSGGAINRSDYLDAINKKHIQNSDTMLAEGTSNKVTASEIVKAIYNIILLAFYRAVDASKTIYNLVNGFIDEYEDESGIDTVNSENEVYDSDGDYYHPFLVGYGSNFLTGGTPSGDSNTWLPGFPASQAFDGDTGTKWLSTGSCPHWIKYDLGEGNEEVANKFRWYNTSHAWVDALFQGSNDDSNWTTLYTLTGGSEILNDWQEVIFVNSTAYRYYRVYITDAYEDDWGSCSELQAMQAITSDSMSLISESQTAESEPSSARIVCFEEDVDAITLNTDLKAYISRDDGLTWAEATLSDEGDYASSKRVIVGTADLSISGVGSGTDMVYKLVTANAKDLKVHGTALLWD